MKRIAVALIISLSLFVAGSQPDIVAPYLAKNCYSLELNNMDLNFMGEDLDCQIFLSGAQWHGTTYNYELQYAMLIALNQQAGVRYLLLDSGYATAQVFNEYVQTGNFELLRLGMEGTRYNNSSCNEYRLAGKSIYNTRLAPRKKLSSSASTEYQVEVINYLNRIPDNHPGRHFPVTEYLGDANALTAMFCPETACGGSALFGNTLAMTVHFQGYSQTLPIL